MNEIFRGTSHDNSIIVVEAVKVKYLLQKKRINTILLAFVQKGGDKL